MRAERSTGHDVGGEGSQFVAEGRQLDGHFPIKKVCAVNLPNTSRAGVMDPRLLYAADTGLSEVCSS